VSERRLARKRTGCLVTLMVVGSLLSACTTTSSERVDPYVPPTFPSWLNTTTTGVPASPDKIIPRSVTALDPKKSGVAYRSVAGNAKTVVIGGLTYEGGEAFNTLWQRSSETARPSLEATRLGDDDFTIVEVAQVNDTTVVLGAIEGGSHGVVRLVTNGNIETIDPELELGEGTFSGFFTKRGGLVAHWDLADGDRIVVWSADGRVWKRLDFLGLKKYDGFAVVELDENYLAVGWVGADDKRTFDSFLFTAEGRGADVEGLNANVNEYPSLSDGPGGPLLSVFDREAKQSVMWRYRNGGWSKTETSYQALDGTRAKWANVYNITGHDSGWYALGVLDSSTGVWYSETGTKWKFLRSPTGFSLRNDTDAVLVDSPAGILLSVGSAFYVVGPDSFVIETLGGSPPLASIDVRYSIVEGRDAFVAVEQRRGESLSGWQSTVYSDSGRNEPFTIPSVSVAESVVNTPGDTALVGYQRQSGSIWDPQYGEPDDSAVFFQGSYDNQWQASAALPALKPSEQLSLVNYGILPEYSVVYRRYFAADGTVRHQVIARPSGTDQWKVTRIADDLIGSIAKLCALDGAVVLLSVPASGKLRILTLNDSGIAAVDTVTIASAVEIDKIDCVSLQQRSEIVVGSTDTEPGKVFVREGDEWVSRPSSAWVGLDETGFSTYSSPTDQIDAVLHRDRVSGRFSLEVFVDAQPAGSFPVEIPGWEDGSSSLRVRGVSRNGVRLVGIHDGFASTVEAPIPLKLVEKLAAASTRNFDTPPDSVAPGTDVSTTQLR
jgi:hypothetical protein